MSSKESRQITIPDSPLFLVVKRHRFPSSAGRVKCRRQPAVDERSNAIASRGRGFTLLRRWNDFRRGSGRSSVAISPATSERVHPSRAAVILLFWNDEHHTRAKIVFEIVCRNCGNYSAHPLAPHRIISKPGHYPKFRVRWNGCYKATSAAIRCRKILNWSTAKP